MTPREDQLPLADDRLWALTAAFCDGTISPEELDHLDALLRGSEDARLFYAAYMDLHGRLQWRFRGGRRGRGEREERRGDGGEAAFADNQPSTINGQPSTIAPIIIEASPTLRPSFFTLHSPLGGFLFSYTVAALIVGLGLLIGWACKVSYQAAEKAEFVATRGDSRGQVSPLRQQGQRQASPPAAGAAERAVVGQVTGTADCHWATWTVDSGQWAVGSEAEIRNPKSEIPNSNFLVPLGAKIKVISGLMEITYDTGAKVILQGPATYEVESANGGFLTVGKLTARVEKRAEGGGRRAEEEAGRSQWAVGGKSEIRNPKSEIPLPPSDQGSKGERTANLPLSHEETGPTTSLAPHPLFGKSEIQNPKSEIPNPQSLIPNPLFSVRTPTAVVTDLGTEFGVQVDRSGDSTAYVFQGKVELRPQIGCNLPAPSGNEAGGLARAVPNAVTLLSVGESARVERRANRMLAVSRGRGQPLAFVRRMPGSAFASGGQVGNLSHDMPPYRLTDLGAVNGVTGSAYGINAVGQVVGQFDLPGGAGHAFLYDKETMKDLGTLGGGSSVADGINALGQVVGEAEVASGDKHAFLCNNGKMTDLGTLGGATSRAYGINAAGQVVGVARNSAGVNRAFLYTAATGMKNLGALGGSKAESWAACISDAGQIAGWSNTKSGQTHAFLFMDGAGMKDLGTLGGDHSYAYCVNAAGQVVGCSEIAGSADRHAFLYSIGAGMKDLGTLGGDKSYALGINASGEVVGHSDMPPALARPSFSATD